MNKFQKGDLVQIKPREKKLYKIGMTSQIQQVVKSYKKSGLEIIELLNGAIFPADCFDHYQEEGAYIYDYVKMKHVYLTHDLTLNKLNNENTF